GNHEHALARNGHAPVDAPGGVADEVFGSWTLVVPDLAARPRIERVALVGAGHIHHAVDDDWRHLQARGVGQAEDPPGNHPRHVARRDLHEGAVPAAGGLAVVTGPIGL